MVAHIHLVTHGTSTRAKSHFNKLAHQKIQIVELSKKANQNKEDK